MGSNACYFADTEDLPIVYQKAADIILGEANDWVKTPFSELWKNKDPLSKLISYKVKFR